MECLLPLFPQNRVRRFLINASLWGLLLLLIGGMSEYLRMEARGEQFRALIQISGITTPELLREAEQNGGVNREDFAAALFIFIECDFVPSAENILAVGVDMQAQNEQGETPLQMAQRLKRTEIIELLKRTGGKQ